MEWNSTTIPPALFDQTRIFPQWPISGRSVADQWPISARSMPDQCPISGRSMPDQ
jgi:hypothetical protein